MNHNLGFHIYAGDGTTLRARGLELPVYQRGDSILDPSHYLAAKPLRDAVNVALTLGQPLLLTGEPGTGKTQLAGSVAFELGLSAPLIFHAKTSSVARDLFYRYDTLRHFHDSQVRKDPTIAPESYITYEALGLAILLSLPAEQADPFLPAALQGKGPIRSVVLIDEIDKAPRDLPNDVLNEIETLSFTIPETGQRFEAVPEYRPIIILTSNSEKNLPDAFLRRCIFYHIPFPGRDQLLEIVQRRLRIDPSFTREMLENAIQHFEWIRSLPLRKRPATAEFLQWIRILEDMRIDVKNLGPQQTEALALSYSVLAKMREDLQLLHSSGAA